MPRDASVANWATRIFDAATIFMAEVIFWMFCTERIRCLTARNGSEDEIMGDALGAYHHAAWPTECQQQHEAHTCLL